MHFTETAFQAALDADPGDRTARLVFADWLDEQGDPRAEGYRALSRVPTAPHGRLTVGELQSMCPADDWPRVLVLSQQSRRAAEDAFATAFARLPGARRAELLWAVAAN